MKKYNLLKNLRVVFITATVIVLVFFGFTIFREKQINSLNVITFLVLILNLIYQIIVRPQKPAEENKKTYGDPQTP
ncbi:MAG: hypothetical protein ACM3KM_00430 [Acidobacteriaceae bacterium]